VFFQNNDLKFLKKKRRQLDIETAPHLDRKLGYSGYSGYSGYFGISKISNISNVEVALSLHINGFGYNVALAINTFI
jgi:hypothetical protein